MPRIPTEPMTRTEDPGRWHIAVPVAHSERFRLQYEGYGNRQVKGKPFVVKAVSVWTHAGWPVQYNWQGTNIKADGSEGAMVVGMSTNLADIKDRCPETYKTLTVARDHLVAQIKAMTQAALASLEGAL